MRATRKSHNALLGPVLVTPAAARGDPPTIAVRWALRGTCVQPRAWPAPPRRIRAGLQRPCGPGAPRPAPSTTTPARQRRARRRRPRGADPGRVGRQLRPAEAARVVGCSAAAFRVRLLRARRASRPCQPRDPRDRRRVRRDRAQGARRRAWRRRTIRQSRHSASAFEAGGRSVGSGPLSVRGHGPIWSRTPRVPRSVRRASAACGTRRPGLARAPFLGGSTRAPAFAQPLSIPLDSRRRGSSRSKSSVVLLVQAQVNGPSSEEPETTPFV